MCNIKNKLLICKTLTRRFLISFIKKLLIVYDFVSLKFDNIKLRHLENMIYMNNKKYCGKSI